MTQPKPNTMDDWSRSDIKHLLMCFKYPDQYPEISLEDAIALIQTKLEEVDRAAKEKRIKDNQSFCGCPMCEHHSAPYRASLKGGDDDN